MDGVLVIDKPQGLTSHDVVAAARRRLGERRIGHTGTLDPLATGVLPLAIGRATRLVRFLVTSEKEYDATVRFGFATDTYDITGAVTHRTDAVPPRDDVLQALQTLSGEYLQRPPAYSAKKVEGRRAYELARSAVPAALQPAPVTVSHVELIDFSGGRARVALTCSAGFYVRTFAHSLGDLVGTGACLEALRRTRSGESTVAAAIRLDDLHDLALVARHLTPLGALLGHLPAVAVTRQGREHVLHGRELEAGDYAPVPATSSPSPRASSVAAWVRLLDTDGGLLGMATSGSRPGSLHPSLVLM
jgi:tRNA pseudouridine55 synthase